MSEVGGKQRPVFLFGVGAQKSGTTWLYQQLSKHPDIGFGWKKEISLWGALWDKGLADRKPKRIRHRLWNQFYAFPNGRILPHYPLFTPFLKKEYFDEFRRVSEAGKSVVADVTPHYSAISGPHFALLREWAEGYGFDPKVVFIMRDPVERVISGIMHSNRRLKNPTNDQLIGLVEETYYSYPVSVRTRYDHSIRNIESAFEPDQVTYIFFEELFTQEVMKNLASRLGIAPIPADFDERVGPATHKVSLPLELRRKIRAHYDPVYAFCRAKFGEERLSHLWRNNDL